MGAASLVTPPHKRTTCGLATHDKSASHSGRRAEGVTRISDEKVSYTFLVDWYRQWFDRCGGPTTGWVREKITKTGQRQKRDKTYWGGVRKRQGMKGSLKNTSGGCCKLGAFPIRMNECAQQRRWQENNKSVCYEPMMSSRGQMEPLQGAPLLHKRLLLCDNN